MQVILLERIGKLGQMGDVVNVKDGFARNFLLPKGKALRATKPNMERFEKERVQLEAHNLELKKEAEGVSTKMDGASIVVIRQAGDSGQLYGSVSTRDIAADVTKAGYEIKRQQVMLDSPIKTLGLHPVRVSLHPEVEVEVTINVARSEDEAQRQARGEDVTAQTDDFEDDDEDIIRPEEVFEDEELAAEAKDEFSEAEEEVAEIIDDAGSDDESAEDADSDEDEKAS